MKNLKFLVLCILSRFASLESSDIKDDATKIFGGDKVQALAYPYALAMFYMENQHFICGASVLNFYYIVSAAHCLVKIPNTLTPWNHYIRHERLMVIGGTNYIREVLKDYSHDDLQEHLGVQRRIIHETFIHTGYRKEPYLGLNLDDIGIGKTHIPFTHLRFSVRPISLFSHVFWRAIHYQYQMYFANKTCYSVGWGNTALVLTEHDMPMVMSRQLNEIPMRVYQTEPCLARLCVQNHGKRCTHSLMKVFVKQRINRFDLVLCTYTVGNRQGGPCTGDSGSPLACSWIKPEKPDDHRGDVVGHVSSSSELCGSRHGGPTFYTEYIHYYGFFNIFDLKFIGSENNPWEPERFDPRCTKEWPDMTHCRRKRSGHQSQTSSSSRLICGAICLIVFSMCAFFSVDTVQ